MQLGEFEKLTGFYPSISLYDEIEGRYNSLAVDKYVFCQMYKENADGLATAIQKAATAKEVAREQELRKEIEELRKKVETLQEKLDEAECWQWTEVSKMPQCSYEELAESDATRHLSLAEARTWIEEEFGFGAGRIHVFTEIPRYQKNQRYLRKNGSVARPPLYNATDWNYIRFDVNGWQYEVVNGHLRQYAD